jgi:negative regulator of sigma E activity
MMITLTSQAEPSAIDDEAFLLFLADTLEEDGELIDPLSITELETETKDTLITKEQEEDHE